MRYRADGPCLRTDLQAALRGRVKREHTGNDAMDLPTSQTNTKTLTLITAEQLADALALAYRARGMIAGLAKG